MQKLIKLMSTDSNAGVAVLPINIISSCALPLFFECALRHPCVSATFCASV